MRSRFAVLAVLALSASVSVVHSVAAAQAPAPPAGAINASTQPPKPGGASKPVPAVSASTAPVVPEGVKLPPGYLIGIQDQLDVFVWKEKDLSAEGVVVRPDGKISLPLVNDIQAAGLSVEQLRAAIEQQASKFVQDATVSVVVKQINSRRVSIMGQVAKAGQYPLLDSITVADALAMAGGVAEYTNKKNIRITRVENGKKTSMVFNYKEFLDGKPRGLEQNIELQPGDIVTVP